MKSTISITDKGKIITFTAVLEKHLESGMYYDEEKTLYLPKRLFDDWNSKELSGDIQARKRFIDRLEKLD
jgi:hypothetical protein